MIVYNSQQNNSKQFGMEKELTSCQRIKILTYPWFFFPQWKIFFIIIIIGHFYKVYYHACSTWQQQSITWNTLRTSSLYLGGSSNRELTAQGPHHENVNKKQMEEECKGCSLSKNRYICSEVLPQLAAACSYPHSFFFLFPWHKPVINEWRWIK